METNYIDRIEITSYGSLPDGLSREDFFTCVSIPGNKELMRIYRNMEMVEQLGSGLPRILKSYREECFHFADSFTPIVFLMEKAVIHTINEDEGLNESDALLSIIKKFPGIQLKEIFELKEGASQRTIERQIAELV